MELKRREFIATAAGSAAALGGAATPGNATAAKTDAGPKSAVARAPYKHIACEEGYWSPETFDAAKAYLATNPPEEAALTSFWNAFGRRNCRKCARCWRG